MSLFGAKKLKWHRSPLPDNRWTLHLRDFLWVATKGSSLGPWWWHEVLGWRGAGQSGGCDVRGADARLRGVGESVPLPLIRSLETMF